jgi:acyl-CoA thioester hydrolase
MFEHSLPIRVYYADTDALGIVYHANYLRYFEAARTESLRALGIELTFLKKEYGVQFAVVHADVKFIRSARIDDKLNVISRINKIGHASIYFHQSIYFADTKEEVCSAEIKLASVNMHMRPHKLPEMLRRINDH